LFCEEQRIAEITLLTESSFSLAHTPKAVQQRIGVGSTKFYALLKSGQLKARKIGRRTVILDSDLCEFLGALPVALTIASAGKGA